MPVPHTCFSGIDVFPPCLHGRLMLASKPYKIPGPEFVSTLINMCYFITIHANAHNFGRSQWVKFMTENVLYFFMFIITDLIFLFLLMQCMLHINPKTNVGYVYHTPAWADNFRP